MRTFASLFLVTVLAFLITGLGSMGYGVQPKADPKQQPPTPPPTIGVPAAAPVEEPSPTLEDYENILAKMEKVTKDFMKFESWDGIKLRNTVTNKVVEWKELSEFDKTMFCLMMCERASAHLSKLNEFWVLELKKFDDPNHKLVPTPMPANEKQKPATKEDAKKYLEKLTSIRKSFAVEYEAYAEKSFKTYEKEVPKEEREKTMKGIREFHDKQKLIERK